MPIQFQEPLWLLLLCALPILVWLHRERQRVLTSDRIGVWERALARLPRARRKRWSLALFCVLFAGLCLILAMADPRIPKRPGLEHVFAVFDVSPSMATLDAGEGRPRLAAAERRWASLQATLPSHVERRTYRLDGHLLEELPVPSQGSLGGTETTARLSLAVGKTSAVLKLAEDFARRREEGEAVLLYTDAAGPSQLSDEVPPRLYPRYLGQASPNDAILEVELLDPWPAKDLKLEVRGRIESSGKALVLRDAAGKELARRKLQSGSFDEALEVSRPKGLVVQLEPGDLAPLDDRLRVPIRSAWSPEILAVPDGDPRLGLVAKFLARAFEGTKVLPQDSKTAEDLLLVTEGGSIGKLPKDGVFRIYFGTELPGCSGYLEQEAAPSWDRSHALLDGLDLGTLDFERCLKLETGQLPGSFEVLAWQAGHPLILWSREGRFLWTAMTLEGSHLGRTAFFPLLLLRSLRAMLEPTKARQKWQVLPGGESHVAVSPKHDEPGLPPFSVPELRLDRYLLCLAGLLLLLRAFLR